ncbi:MAG: hypothetical protein GQ549_00310 [Gammaproteobacteria bacterium]|nr:hypothetical protein [Gammaproteobacteria bacterium]
MNNIYRIITLLLVISITACVSNQPNMTASNDEDRDIGLGGTGMLANTDDGSGLGGTGILGEITGYGSIFVNGIEIEYDNETAFTINGETTAPQQLKIGDVVEVLTNDGKQHTQARKINLRHEIIGVVESVEPQTYSFTVQGQSIIQAIDKLTMPEVGTTVAVAGFRMDEKTILSTRVTAAETGQVLLRTGNELPFNSEAQSWLIQTHIQNGKAIFNHQGDEYVFSLKEKTNKSFKDRLAIKILRLQKSAVEKLELKQVIKASETPRGRRTLEQVQQPVQHQGGSILQRATPGSVLAPQPGSGINQPQMKQKKR